MYQDDTVALTLYMIYTTIRYTTIRTQYCALFIYHLNRFVASFTRKRGENTYRKKNKTRRGGGTSESVFTTTTITGPHTRSRRLRNHLLELCVNSDRHPSSASFATISAVRNGSCLQRTIIVALQHDILSRPTRHGSPTSTSSVRFRAWGQVRIKCVKIINIYWACVLLQNSFFDLFEIICLSLLILMDVIGFVVGINCDSGRLHVKHTVKKENFFFVTAFSLLHLCVHRAVSRRRWIRHRTRRSRHRHRAPLHKQRVHRQRKKNSRNHVRKFFYFIFGT